MLISAAAEHRGTAKGTMPGGRLSKPATMTFGVPLCPALHSELDNQSALWRLVRPSEAQR